MISLKSRLKRYIFDNIYERWIIGIITTPLDDILSGKPIHVEWIKDDDKKRWFADPFIIHANEREIIMLVEEVNFHGFSPNRHGRISRITIDRQSHRIKSCEMILKLDSHLSFPAYYRKNDDIFIYPENSASGCLTLYRYNDSSRQVSKECVLCDDSLVDAIQTHYFDEKRLMFATTKDNQNGNELGVYAVTGENKKFKLIESLKFDENIARNAGLMFRHNGNVYRPAQLCDDRYGHAVVLQQMSHENGQWQFKDIRRIYSNHPVINKGCHTFNVFADGLVSIDAWTHKRPLFRKLFFTMYYRLKNEEFNDIKGA